MALTEIDPQLDLWQALYPALVTLPLYIQELTETVRALRPDVRVDTSRLELVVAQMAAVVQQLQDREPEAPTLDLEPVTERLERLIKASKATGGPIMSAAHSSGVIITDNQGRQAKVNADGTLAITAAMSPQVVTTEIDYGARTDGNPVYIGTATPGSATSAAVWNVQQFTYDSSNRCTSIKNADGISWDGRASASYS